MEPQEKRQQQLKSNKPQQMSQQSTVRRVYLTAETLLLNMPRGLLKLQRTREKLQEFGS